MTLEQAYLWHLKTITDERHGLIATGSTILQDIMLDLGMSQEEARDRLGFVKEG